MASTLDTVEALLGMPGTVAHYLSDPNLKSQVVAWTTLQPLDWAGADIGVEFRLPVREAQANQEYGDFIGITDCLCMIAEADSLMLLSGLENITSTALLSETYTAVILQSRIVVNLEDAYALVRAEHDELSRATSVVSRPSRTDNIKQTIVLGARGPYRVHVIVATAA